MTETKLSEFLNHQGGEEDNSLIYERITIIPMEWGSSVDMIKGEWFMSGEYPMVGTSNKISFFNVPLKLRKNIYRIIRSIPGPSAAIVRDDRGIDYMISKPDHKGRVNRVIFFNAKICEKYTPGSIRVGIKNRGPGRQCALLTDQSIIYSPGSII